MAWTAGCSGGLASGPGTLGWVWDGGQKSTEGTGLPRGGKVSGKWCWSSVEGTVSEGPYVDDERHGYWCILKPDGCTRTETRLNRDRQ